MSEIDTSAEAVEHVAGHLDVAACAASNAARGPRGDAPPPEESWYGQAAALLRALLAERDAERAKVTRLESAWLHCIQIDNDCKATGLPCKAQCSCVEEREVLTNEVTS